MLHTQILALCVILPLIGITCGQVLTPAQPAKIDSAATNRNEQWHTLPSGAERRIMRFKSGENSYEMLLYRLNQKNIQVNISYAKEAQRLETVHQEQHALLSINGSYFTEEMTPTGLFIDEGRTIAKQAYAPDESGTLLIEKGQARILTTGIDTKKISADADLLQSFPMLVVEGKANVPSDSGKIARRTAIAIDVENHLIVIVVDQTALSLYLFAQLLAESDLGIVQALNLDGGPSTGLIYTDAAFTESYLPLMPLPIVLNVLQASPAAPNDR